MDWETLGKQLEARSRVYARKFGIDRTPEWSRHRWSWCGSYLGGQQNKNANK